MELGFTNAANPLTEDFMGWVVGFHGEHSDELTKLPTTLADAQVARCHQWQGSEGTGKYGLGRDPTDQHWQRSWLVNKI